MLKEVYVAACLGVLLAGCVQVKPLKSVVVSVRDTDADTAMPGLPVEFQLRPAPGSPHQVLTVATNTLGAAGLRIPKRLRFGGISNLDFRRDVLKHHLITVVVHDTVLSGTTRRLELDGFNGLIDVGFSKHLPATTRTDSVRQPWRVADMHYHVSMRAHNRFGDHIYPDAHLPAEGTLPDGIAWYHSTKKLKCLLDGKTYSIPEPTWSRMRQAGGMSAAAMKRRRMEALLNGAIWSAGGNNKLNQYTQATFPHVRDGGVKLAYNAISPFEANLNNSGQKRIVSSLAKSGGSRRWLLRMGAKRARVNDFNFLLRFGRKRPTHRMTHWQNFLLEHRMMKEQDRAIDGLNWRFLHKGSELDTASSDAAYVVTVIEGGHALQHKLFPNEVDYDMGARTPEQDQGIVDSWKKVRETDTPGYASRWFTRLDSLSIEVKTYEDSVNAYRLRFDEPTIRARVIEGRKLVRAQRTRVIDAILLSELRTTIDSLKRLDPPVHMMTVAHLSYNGMLGHAPAIDDATFFGRLSTRRVYAIRVSEDPQYLDQWKGLFFTASGVNQFGDTMMRRLLSREHGARRILIDLKHSDVLVRKFFFDSLMVRRMADGSVDRVPPICSHCAVTGMSVQNWSPFNDEFALLRAPFTPTLYPFGINLFDEEVLTIHRNDGIIGLPLEQRVLGGSMNKRLKRAFPLNKKGLVRLDKKKNWGFRFVREARRTTHNAQIQGLFHRFDHTYIIARGRQERMFLSRAMNSTCMLRGLDADMRNKKDSARVLEATIADYISVEPLLQNLFHIIDLIRSDASTDGLSGNDHCGYAWSRVCIGSDLDGIIDPIDICPTAAQYPLLRQRMKDFIPLFLTFRHWERERDSKEDLEATSCGYTYFDHAFTIDHALDAFFYGSLRDFTSKHVGR